MGVIYLKSRGHFYFAQRGHYHFAATGRGPRLWAQSLAPKTWRDLAASRPRNHRSLAGPHRVLDNVVFPLFFPTHPVHSRRRPPLQAVVAAAQQIAIHACRTLSSPLGSLSRLSVRITIPALSVARWVLISTIATFPGAPL